jgi:AcrR family transcriptional regulator
MGRIDAPTDTRILSIALELFTTHGYEGTSVGDISERLGMTKAALYYHFSSKEDILVRLIRPYLEAVDAVIAGAPEVSHSVKGRRELLGSFADLLLEHRAMVRFISRDVSALSQGAIRQRTEEQTRRLRTLLTGPRGGVAAEVRATAAVGVLSRPVVTLPEVDLDGFRDMLIDAAMGVLRSKLPRKNDEAEE